jgi:hypothetical protein
MVGIIGSLDLHPVFLDASPYRLPKLKRDDSIKPLCKYFGQAIAQPLLKQGGSKRLSKFRLSPSVVVALLLGEWAKIDLEQVLVLNVALVEDGKKPLDKGRPRSQWFADEHLMLDMLTPFSALLSSLGYDCVSGPGSLANVIALLRKKLQFARHHPDVGADVKASAIEALHLAISDGAEGWVQYFMSHSPAAPFPDSFVKPDSDIFSDVNRVVKTARKAVDIAADLPSFIKAIAQAGAPANAPASSSAPASAPALAPARKAPGSAPKSQGECRIRVTVSFKPLSLLRGCRARARSHWEYEYSAGLSLWSRELSSFPSLYWRGAECF